MSKNQVRSVSVLTIIAIIFGVFFYIISPSSVDISRINWEDIPGIIAINNHERNEQTGILTIKLSDGTEEFLPGAWDINYGKEGRTYIYGKTSRESDEQVINYIEPSGRIKQLGFNLFDGSINNVSESPDSTYLLIDFGTVDSQTFCFVTFIGGTGKDCSKLHVKKGTRAMWNKNKAKEIGILFEDGLVKKLNPWIGDALDVKKDSDEYAEIKQQFDADEQEDKPTIQQLLAIAFVKTSDGVSLHKVPLGSKLSFVNGDDHILIKEENQLSILELKTRKKATFLEKNDIHKSPVTVFDGISKQEI